jgi:hypothetical protein
MHTILTYNYQDVRAAAGSSSATLPISSTTTSTPPSEVFSYFYIFSVKYPILYSFLQQQTGTSASTPSMQAPQSTHVDAPQPIVAEAQTKRKALTDAEAQQKRQKSTPAPSSALTPVNRPTDIIEQAASSVQDTPSAIIPQGPTTDEVVEDIPSASSVDPSHDLFQAAPSSQAQEIALKQVNRLTVWFIISPDTTNRIPNSLYFTGTRFSR